MILIIALILLAVLLIVFYFWLKNKYSYWDTRYVVHEKPKFFYGNIRGLGRKYHWTDFLRCVYGKFKDKTPLTGIFMYTTPVAVLLDLDLIERILVKEFEAFPYRGLFYNLSSEPMTGNLLFLDGEPWRCLREKLLPMFSPCKIKKMFPHLVELGHDLACACDKLTQECNGSVDITKLADLYTTDVIASFAFGLDSNSLKNPNSHFRKMTEQLFECPLHCQLIRDFMTFYPETARKFPLKLFRKKTSNFFINTLRETFEYRKQQKVEADDFVDSLLCIFDTESCEGIKEIAVQSMSFFIAGFQTTSTTLALCLYELALNEDIQDKLRAEIRCAVEGGKKGLTFDVMKDMTYLEMVFSETLRKYTIIPHLVRESKCFFQIPCTSITLEKNTRLIIPIDAIHHDPDIYPEPETFDPTRFKPENIDTRHPFAFLPFGQGPRNCPGQLFGKLQVQVAIVMLIRYFRFSTSALTEIPIKKSKKHMNFVPLNGIHLSAQKLIQGKSRGNCQGNSQGSCQGNSQGNCPGNSQKSCK